MGVLVLAVALFLPSCTGGGSLPSFCGVTDEARLAVANASPDRYPSVAGQHVEALRAAAKDLTGTEGTLAQKVVTDLQAASEAAPKSTEFTDAYDRFVADSNQFNDTYCILSNEPPG